MTQRETIGNETVAIEFFRRWGMSYSDLLESFVDTFSEECIWDQRPLAKTVGAHEATKFMNISHRFMRLETIDVDVLRISSIEQTVFSERIDHLYTKGGKLLVSAPVVGVMQFEAGKITRWKEYFDAAGFIGQALVNGVKGPFGPKKGIK